MAQNIIASTRGTNTAVIALSSTGYIALDITPLQSLGFWGSGLNYNILLLVNNHTAAILVKIGNDTQYIAAGDAYEWLGDNQVFFNTISITELGAAAQIDIDDIKYTARRVR